MEALDLNIELGDVDPLLARSDPDSALDAAIRRALKKHGLAPEQPFAIQRRAVDARRGRVRLALRLHLGRSAAAPLADPAPLREVGSGPPVLIVGAGPAGLFCAWALARAGVPALLFERGRKVQPRRRDLVAVNRKGQVPEDSNYCFGEGGAGTYSDGKLYTRSDKRGPVREVLEILAACGAPERILVDARPHIGTNRLPAVVTAMRERLEAAGVQLRFETRVEGIRTWQGRAVGLRLRGGDEVEGRAVVLATGHSARDVYRFVDAAGVRLEPKTFALGVRVEHPQTMVDRAQYGAFAEHPLLGAASYRLVHTDDAGLGVWSFCMCPGGFIVPATTEAGALVVNGMSPSRRNSRFANSGIVVGLAPEQWEALGHRGPWGGLELQAQVEAAAWTAGGGAVRAPAARVPDFLAGRVSSSLPDCSYTPGLTPAELREVLPELVWRRLASGIEIFSRRLRGFDSEDAVMVGVESRTSAPLRIPRHRESLESPDLAGLYPVGEGAGYAGGIVSAAIDGMRAAEAIIRRP